MDHTNQTLRDLRRHIGRNIHTMRCQKKWTLKKFSRLTRISTDRLDEYELGREPMYLKELVRIASVFGTNIACLLQSDADAL